MVLPLLPTYAKQLTVDEQGWMIGLLMASFSAMQFLFSPVWGRISDRIGRRPVLMIGLAGSCVCYFLFALATTWESLTWLFVARIGAGICGATISTAQAYIADVTPLESRAKGMALIGAAFGLGFTFGPLIGATALLATGDADLSPWPGYVASALSAVALAMAAVRLPESLIRSADRPTKHGHFFDFAALREALATPSLGMLLGVLFVAVFSLANFESTLALLLRFEEGGYSLSHPRMLFVFAYVGLTLTVAQGFIVRRLATRVSEGVMATSGALISAIGYMMLANLSGPMADGPITDDTTRGLGMLLVALAVSVVGFSLVSPSLNSLISRRSDPDRQGGILGVGQSVSSLARIVGPIFGIRLFHVEAGYPFWAAAAMLLVTAVLVTIAVRRGKDFVAT